MKSNKILYVLISIALFLGYVMLKYYIRTDYKKEETDSKTVFIAIIAVGLIWRYVIEPHI